MSIRVGIDLTASDREELRQLTRKGKASARKLNRARILLLVDEGHSEQEIAAILQTSGNTIWRTKVRYNEGGLELALNDIARPGAPHKLDSQQEAVIVALACSAPPEGYSQWTMQLLADRLVELNVVDNISDETIRLMLKKTGLSLGKKKHGAFQQ